MVKVKCQMSLETFKEINRKDIEMLSMNDVSYRQVYESNDHWLDLNELIKDLFKKKTIIEEKIRWKLTEKSK